MFACTSPAHNTETIGRALDPYQRDEISNLLSDMGVGDV